MEPIWEATGASTTRVDTPPPSRKDGFERDAEDDDTREIDIDDLSDATNPFSLLTRSTAEHLEAQNKLTDHIGGKTSPGALHSHEPDLLLSPPPPPPPPPPPTATTTASVLTALRTLDLVTRHISDPGPDDVQIAIKGTGICGSDLHYHSHFSVAGFPVLEPLTLGHESAGIVTPIGSNVLNSQFQIGDRIVLEVGVPCSLPDCDRCS